MQSEAISLVTVHSKELWLVEETYATVKPDSRVASRGMKTYSESRIELRNLSSQFLSSEQPCEPKSLDVVLNITGVRKSILGELMVAVNLEAIWFEVWMQGAFVTVEMCVFCGWWFSNQFDVMSETSFSCDTVGHEGWLAILSSLLCPETDWNIRIGQQGYVFILTDFKVMFVSFLTSISVLTANLRLGKVEFLK